MIIKSRKSKTLPAYDVKNDITLFSGQSYIYGEHSKLSYYTIFILLFSQNLFKSLIVRHFQ